MLLTFNKQIQVGKEVLTNFLHYRLTNTYHSSYLLYAKLFLKQRESILFFWQNTMGISWYTKKSLDVKGNDNEGLTTNIHQRKLVATISLHSDQYMKRCDL